MSRHTALNEATESLSRPGHSCGPAAETERDPPRAKQRSTGECSKAGSLRQPICRVEENHDWHRRLANPALPRVFPGGGEEGVKATADADVG